MLVLSSEHYVLCSLLWSSDLNEWMDIQMQQQQQQSFYVAL